jgi:pimeloyl-ACP methyl ester carboxylesterase
MIAQTMAIRHPDRVHSLTSIMSTPWFGIGSPTAAVQAALSSLSMSPATTCVEVVDQAAAFRKIIGSPGYPMDEAWIREVAGQSYDRCFDPTGIARQRLAVGASGDRIAALVDVTATALVVHGDADPWIPLRAGRATAAALPNAELLVVPGMGHDLPCETWPTLVTAISRLADRAEALHTSAVTDAHVPGRSPRRG